MPFPLPIRLGLVALLLAASAGARAWGAHGHQVVGGIADQLLAGTRAATEVRKILGSNLQTAALWADCVRGVVGQGSQWDYPNKGDFPECAPYENAASIAAMKSFVRRNAQRCGDGIGDEVCRHKAYHYTDVALQRAGYAQARAGTSDHDIVHATAAAIRVLQDRDAPAPFGFASKREALRLLAHYVGDLHQPLHVGAVYLDGQGRRIDPDPPPFDERSASRGGNHLLLHGAKLHALWDGIPGALAQDLLAGTGAGAARQLPDSGGPIASWPQQWADQALAASVLAHDGLVFGARRADGRWPVTGAPADYDARRVALQRRQLVAAGARLAQLLRTLWP